jgi:hypothetical protein
MDYLEKTTKEKEANYVLDANKYCRQAKVGVAAA